MKHASFDRAQHLRHQPEEAHVRRAISRRWVARQLRRARLGQHVELEPQVLLSIGATKARLTERRFSARRPSAPPSRPPPQLQPEATHDPAPLQHWFNTWTGPIISEGRDLDVAVGGDVAYAHCLRHLSGTKRDGKDVDLWFRATACFRREGDRWRIAHMHNSVPFAMDGSDKALLDLKP